MFIGTSDFFFYLRNDKRNQMKYLLSGLLSAAIMSNGLLAQTCGSALFDSNDDSVVTVTDLLGLLSFFGDVDSDGDGTWDSVDLCLDTNACNYTKFPTEPCQYLDALMVCGGDCASDDDSDGICDSIDNCLGIIDECGVCNGNGPEIAYEIVQFEDSVFDLSTNEWTVWTQIDTITSYICGEPCTNELACNYGSVIEPSF